MKPFAKFRDWGMAYPRFMNYLRIILGLVLVWKGIFFILNLDLLDLYVKEIQADDSLGLSVCINLLAQLIIILNLLGGFCIIFNLYMRQFCLANLPVLFGAVFLANMQRGTFQPHAEFWLSLFSLLAIIALVITHAGEATNRRTNAETA
jgi:putative oxidoreductase